MVVGKLYTTPKRKITMIEELDVPAQFTKMYSAANVLTSDELPGEVKVTLENDPDVLNTPITMDVTWSVVDSDGNPTVYSENMGAVNIFKWEVDPSVYAFYDANEIKMEGTVSIRNSILVVYPAPTENPTVTPEPSAAPDVPSVTEMPDPTAEPAPTEIPPNPEKTPDVPSATVLPKPTVTPSPKGTPKPTSVPGKTPSGNEKPQKGKSYTDDGGTGKYTVTAKKKNTYTVVYCGPVKKNRKKIRVAATVKIHGTVCKVTAIEDSAFAGCRRLTKLTIGKNVKKIGKKAFYGCKKLKKLTVYTKKLTKKRVGGKAFDGTPKKMLVTVPKSKRKRYRRIFRGRGISRTALFRKRKSQEET